MNSSLTMGRRDEQGNWLAVTDHGERVIVPQQAVSGWQPAPGQRVVADLDPDGVVVRVQVPGVSPRRAPGSSSA